MGAQGPITEKKGKDRIIGGGAREQVGGCARVRASLCCAPHADLDHAGVP